MMRYGLVLALLLAAVPALADAALERRLMNEALKSYDKVASDAYGDYYVDRDVFQKSGYVVTLYAIALKKPDAKGIFITGRYKFSCRGHAQMMDGEYYRVTPSDYGSPYLGSGEELRPDSSMKKIEDPAVAAMEKYACK